MSVVIDGNDWYTRSSFWAAKEPFTTMAWWYCTSLPDAGLAYRALVGHKWTSGNNGMTQGLHYVSGTPRYFLGTNNFNFDGTATTIAVNTWYHTAHVRSGTSHTGYINGATEAGATGTDDATTSGDLVIGDWNAVDDGDEWQGRIAAVKIWDAALTQAEIQNEMRQVMPFRTTNLLAFLPMTTISDDEIDFSGHGATLTVTGSPVTADGPPVPWRRGFGRKVYIPSAGGAFTITIAGGTYAITGTATGLLAARKIVPAAGSYAITGTTTGLKASRNIVAVPGSYSITGTTTILRRGYNLAVAAGSYAVTGATVALRAARRLAAAIGSYVLTGSETGLTPNIAFTPVSIVNGTVYIDQTFDASVEAATTATGTVYVSTTQTFTTEVE